MKKKSICDLLLIIIVLFFSFFFLVPMIMGVYYSLTDWNGLSLNYELIGLENYIKMFSDDRFKTSLIITMEYASILLLFSLLFGYIGAKIISQVNRLKSGILFVSFLPYIITPVIVCILWNQMYIGLFPQIGELLNISFLETNVLSNKRFALLAVAVVDLWMLIPYVMLIFTSVINKIPSEIIESAHVEGANWYKTMIHIEFPYLVPALGMIVTVILSYALTHIDTIMTLTSGGPNRATETIYYIIYRNSSLEQQYAYGLAQGIVIAIVSIVIFIILSKITNSSNIDDLSS